MLPSSLTSSLTTYISDEEYSKLKKHPIIGLSPKANIKTAAGFLKGAMGTGSLTQRMGRAKSQCRTGY
jgi:hypothetical protein